MQVAWRSDLLCGERQAVLSASAGLVAANHLSLSSFLEPIRMSTRARNSIAAPRIASVVLPLSYSNTREAAATSSTRAANQLLVRNLAIMKTGTAPTTVEASELVVTF
jgi:aspartate oxidase